MQAEFTQLLLSATGGLLLGGFGMFKWADTRLRELELHRVTPADLATHIAAITAIHAEMLRDIKSLMRSVSRIEGKMGTADRDD